MKTHDILKKHASKCQYIDINIKARGVFNQKMSKKNFSLKSVLQTYEFPTSINGITIQKWPVPIHWFQEIHKWATKMTIVAILGEFWGQFHHFGLQK